MTPKKLFYEGSIKTFIEGIFPAGFSIVCTLNIVLTSVCGHGEESL
jgi:hypothetical protein